MERSYDQAEVDGHVRNIERAKAQAQAKPTSMKRAIRAHCIECVGGELSEVRSCTGRDCPLYPWRLPSGG